MRAQRSRPRPERRAHGRQTWKCRTEPPPAVRSLGPFRPSWGPASTGIGPARAYRPDRGSRLTILFVRDSSDDEPLIPRALRRAAVLNPTEVHRAESLHWRAGMLGACQSLEMNPEGRRTDVALTRR